MLTMEQLKTNLDAASIANLKAILAANIPCQNFDNQRKIIDVCFAISSKFEKTDFNDVLTLMGYRWEDCSIPNPVIEEKANAN